MTENTGIRKEILLESIQSYYPMVALLKKDIEENWLVEE